MPFPILTSLIAVPVIGTLLLFFVRDDEQNEGMIRKVALGVSLLVFALTLLLWAQFDAASADFQFVARHGWIPAFGIDYAVGVDGISLLLVVLTGFLTPIALLSSWESVHKKTRAFCMVILLLGTGLCGALTTWSTVAVQTVALGRADLGRAAAYLGLTEKEREVFGAVARGLSNTEIAELVFASESTVKTHVGAVLRKLALRDRVQVVVFAHQHGLVS